MGSFRMKSYARRLMETVLREEDMPVSDLPADKGAEVSPAQPQDQVKVTDVLAGLDQPEKLADMVDGCHEMCGRYMDEEDQEVFTPVTEEDKQAVELAKDGLGKAAEALRRVRK